VLEREPLFLRWELLFGFHKAQSEHWIFARQIHDANQRKTVPGV
jgi:hypothetical protein